MKVLVSFVLRTVVLVALTAILFVLWQSSEETSSDPLGLGLLLFAMYVGVAGLWGIWDGSRNRFGPSLLVWLLVGLAIGVLIPFINIVDRRASGAPAADLGADLASSVPFFTILILVPAAVGLGLGAVIRAASSPR